MTPREAAQAIWRAALAAGDVAPLVRRALRLEGDVLTAAGFRLDLVGRRVVVLGCGKASAAMAAAVEDVLGARVADGFVVVKDGYVAATRRVRVVEAGHPVPDARSEAATGQLLAMARAVGPDDLVIVLVSGGGSALTPAPAPGVSLADKQAVTRVLLEAGATIDELNAVRKHLSLFKGGQLARVASPARVLALILSDVIDDPLDVIASGPTAPDPTTFADAWRVLVSRGVADRVPDSVRTRLTAGVRGEIEETPKPGEAVFARVTNLVIGNAQLVVDAAVARARTLGYAPQVLTRALRGEARDVARALLARGRELAPPACLVAAGETTVTVVGRGRGGRCQEFALAAALALEPDEPLVVLAAGTDGTDGPTAAAGGVVDAGTVARGRMAGLDARQALDDNDSHAFLAAAGDLVLTGPTNTNLLDLYLVLRPACPSPERIAPSA